MSKFQDRLISEFINNSANNFDDNHDKYRFGPEKSPNLRDRIKNLLFSAGIDVSNPKYLLSGYKEISEHLEDIAYLYDLLDDEKSKDLLIQLVAYRVMGKKKVKLPLNSPKFWEDLDKLKDAVNKDDFIQIGLESWKLPRTDLRKFGFPIELYNIAIGTNCTYVLEQYRYREANGNTVAVARKGDVVVDLGGCWGDTALYFASLVGRKGRVFSFEFIPSNLEIFRKNLDLNPELSEIVEIIPRPAWSESNNELIYTDNGPASTVGFDLSSQDQGKALTLSVDDLIEDKNLDRVNFVKMDIEGAERFAIEGATKTISKFRPILAIAIYHSISDFVTIPRLIDDLGLGYKLYLGHYTIHLEESILFAIPNS